MPISPPHASTTAAKFRGQSDFQGDVLNRQRMTGPLSPDDFQKAKAELVPLRKFIDFVNRQVGVYCDCLASFSGNVVRIERQIPRLQRPFGRRIEQGRPVIVYASVEDPTSPDVIHHRIVRADEFVSTNREAGFNEQQLCWSIIVFMFAFWDEEIRPQIARIREVKTSAVTLDELGDLRLLRHNIVHNGGVMAAADHAKLKVMVALCAPDRPISLTHDQMHQIFVFVKQAIGRLILQYTGQLPGAPNAEDIVGVAIQNP